METTHDTRDTGLYSPGNSHKPVHFYFEAPHAKAVHIIGDFSRWMPVAMEHRADGWWFIQIMLTHGHHRYRFVVDGRLALDPQASGVARDEHDQLASLVAVS